MSRFQRAVPVLQVRDVERSMGWYVDTFGFQPDPFPEKPPYGFAILRRDDSEIMLQSADVEEKFHSGDGWPYICAYPVRISWTSQKPSGGLPHLFEGRSACSMASSSLKLSTQMATTFV